MILINNIIVNDDVVEEHFACNLNACKGACCWEGDYGAPLESDEIEIIDNLGEILAPYLEAKSLKLLEEEGGTKYFEDAKMIGTNLHKNGACVYLAYKDGISLCSIEQAWKDGKTTFRKPISCHLYPIRIDKDDRTLFETMSYDVWDICSAACQKGAKDKIRVYEFAKEAIIRKFGEEFYERLKESANNH